MKDNQVENAQEATAAASGFANVAGEIELTDVNQLRAELEAQTAEAQENLDKLRRTMADFSNYRKRQEKEQEQATKWANARIITELLPVIDDLERAIVEFGTDGQEPAWLQGIKLVEHKLESALAKFGLEEIVAEPGVPFDPNIHEAVLYQEAENYGEGAVTATMRKGYKLGERVLRATMVSVSKAPTS
jgi:molecular chaperone GrpE